MDPIKEEMEKLEQAKQAFKTHTFNKQQVEVILGRKLTDKEWKAYKTKVEKVKR